MAFKFVIFVALIAMAFAWPYDRQFYDEPEGGGYQRPHGGYGRPSYGNDGYNQQQQGGYGRPSGGYGRPHGGYGRPSNVDNSGSDNWQGPSQGSQWQGQGPQQQGGFHQGNGGGEGGFHQQQPNHGPIPSSPFGGRFDGSSAAESGPQPNPSTFGERLGGPTTGNNFSPQVNVEPTNKVAEGVKTFGGAGTPPPTSANAPLDPNIDLTGSRVFHNDGNSDSGSASPPSPDATPSQNGDSSGPSGPSEAEESSSAASSSNDEDLTGLPRGTSGDTQGQQPSQDPATSEPETKPSGPLFGGAQPGEGTDASDSSSSGNNEPAVTIDPSATADSGLVLG